MDELEKSLRYVPTYQVVEKIRKEEKRIAREKLAVEKDKTKSAQEKAKEAQNETKAEREQRKKAEQEKEQILTSAISFLLEKQIEPAQIAKILDISSQKLSSIIKKITNH